MANPNNATGFRPVRDLSGAPYNGAARAYSMPTGDGTAVGAGDFVKLVGTGQTIDGQVYADVARAATGDVVLGAITSVKPITRDSTIYREASTQRIVYVADNPRLLFEAQENTGTAFTANDISLNCNFVVTAGVSTTTGQSGMEIDTVGEAGTNTLDLQLVEFVNRPDNAIGANAKWLVRINRHQFSNQVAGA